MVNIDLKLLIIFYICMVNIIKILFDMSENKRERKLDGMKREKNENVKKKNYHIWKK